MTYPIGVDVSVWDGLMDWNKAKNAGAKFAFMKASQKQKDVQFDNNWKNAKAAGMPRGAYHFLDWSVSEITQADLFVSVMNGDWGELPPVLDLEMTPPSSLMTLDSISASDKGKMGIYLKNYNEPKRMIEASLTLSKDEMRGKVWNFLNRVEAKTGKIPNIYSGYFYWTDWMTNSPNWLKYDFWLAWYNSESIIKTPAPWSTWTFWQYTDGGNGSQYGAQSASIDMNYFHGTNADLAAYIGGDVPTPPPTTTYYYKTSVNVNVRNGAGDTDPVIGVITAGTLCSGAGATSGSRTKILTPMVGWVWSSYLIPTSNPGVPCTVCGGAKVCQHCKGSGIEPQ